MGAMATLAWPCLPLDVIACSRPSTVLGNCVKREHGTRLKAAFEK